VLGVGSQTLKVVFTPADTTDYTTANATVQLMVNRATPVISWATPPSINYGTPLSATQLDATANVPGTFVYSPAAGAILPAGTNTLTTAFTPSDTTDYTTASASVSLVVNQLGFTLSAAPSTISLKQSGKTTSTIGGANRWVQWSCDPVCFRSAKGSYCDVLSESGYYDKHAHFYCEQRGEPGKQPGHDHREIWKHGSDNHDYACSRSQVRKSRNTLFKGDRSRATNLGRTPGQPRRDFRC
jgi:hypothetical protein